MDRVTRSTRSRLQFAGQATTGHAQQIPGDLLSARGGSHPAALQPTAWTALGAAGVVFGGGLSRSGPLRARARLGDPACSFWGPPGGQRGIHGPEHCLWHGRGGIAMNARRPEATDRSVGLVQSPESGRAYDRISGRSRPPPASPQPIVACARSRRAAPGCRATDRISAGEPPRPRRGRSRSA